MEWLWIIGGLFILVVMLGARSKNRKSATKAAQVTAYAADVDAAKKQLLAADNWASLPVLSPRDHGYRLVGKENLLAVQDGATRLEMKSTGRYRTGGTSVSVPIMKGVRYRVGSGSFKTERSLQSTDTGRLLVTDKAMVFEGRARNERITWTQIASI